MKPFGSPPTYQELKTIIFQKRKSADINYNQDPNLTLRTRRRSITAALEHVEHGDEGSRDGVHPSLVKARYGYFAHP